MIYIRVFYPSASGFIAALISSAHKHTHKNTLSLKSASLNQGGLLHNKLTFQKGWCQMKQKGRRTRFLTSPAPRTADIRQWISCRSLTPSWRRCQGLCGDADKVHSQTVYTTHSQHRPVLFWTCKPNEGTHAELKRIDKSFSGMISAAETQPARAYSIWRRYRQPVLYFLHIQRLVTARGRSILCVCRLSPVCPVL